jgi:hypothetical protein
VHEVGAHESNEFEEAAGFFCDLLQGAQKKKGNQSDGDLDAHSVLRASDELRDPERLFHHPEEELHLPAALVEVGDLLSRRVEIVGQKAQGLTGLGPDDDLALPTSCIGFLRFVACRAGRKPIRSLSTVDPGSSGISRGALSGVFVLKRVTSRQPSASSFAQKPKS